MAKHIEDIFQKSEHQKQIKIIIEDTATNTNTGDKWIQQNLTDEILGRIDDRRKEINKEIRRKVRLAKEIWYSNKIRKNRRTTFYMYNKIKAITKTHKSTTSSLVGILKNYQKTNTQKLNLAYNNLR